MALVMFFPSLSSSQIPDTVWLPPELRGDLKAVPEKQVSSHSILEHRVSCLLAHLEHIEAIVRQMDMETRLERLETLTGRSNVNSSFPSRTSGA
jgi:hypothetical protein